MFYRDFGLFKEILWVTVGQRVKDNKVTSCQSLSLKKMCCLATYAPSMGGPGSSPRSWDHPQSFTDHNFAVLLPSEPHSTSLERPETP